METAKEAYKEHHISFEMNGGEVLGFRLVDAMGKNMDTVRGLDQPGEVLYVPGIVHSTICYQVMVCTLPFSYNVIMLTIVIIVAWIPSLQKREKIPEERHSC